MATTTSVKPAAKKRPARGESAPRGDAARPGSGTRAGSGSGGGPSSSTSTPDPKMSAEDRKLHASLVRLYATLGTAAHGMGEMKGDLTVAAAGVNIAAQAEDTATAWIEVAQQNPRVRAALSGMVTGGALGGLIIAHVAMAMPFLASRGVVQPQVALMFMHPEAQGYVAAKTAAAAAA